VLAIAAASIATRAELHLAGRFDHCLDLPRLTQDVRVIGHGVSVGRNRALQLGRRRHTHRIVDTGVGISSPAFATLRFEIAIQPDPGIDVMICNAMPRPI
jgi:hypothetical protein